MQKFILVPDARYNNLIQKEKSNAGYKQAVDATVKNLENQELLHRQQYYQDANEEIPKNHNKVIKQTAITRLPPPPIKKVQDKRMKLWKQWQEEQLMPKVIIPKPKKTVVRKPVIAKQTVCKMQTPNKNEPNILDKLKFVKPKKHY